MDVNYEVIRRTQSKLLSLLIILLFSALLETEKNNIYNSCNKAELKTLNVLLNCSVTKLKQRKLIPFAFVQAIMLAK